MSRFYERYGHVIVWVLTSILGLALLCWCVSYLAAQGAFPPHINGPILGIRNELVELLVAFASLLHRNSPLVGAVATLFTFLVGLVNGILHARRRLPVRLMRFMDDEVAPVYQNSEAIVAAVTMRSANVPDRSPLYHKAKLDQALNALGDPWRPRRKSSLDDSISETETYIEVTQKRLEHLQNLRDHARLLRGAVQCYDNKRVKPATGDDSAERDFTDAAENPTTKAAALELRGLLRSRNNNLTGALQDFEALQEVLNDLADPRGVVRALRLQADVKIRQSGGTIMSRLTQAQALLNLGQNLLDDGRTLVDDDHLELGQNRQTYGLMKEKMHAISENDMHLAIQSYEEARTYYATAKLDQAARYSADVKQRVDKLSASKAVIAPKQSQ